MFSTLAKIPPGTSNKKAFARARSEFQKFLDVLQNAKSIERSIAAKILHRDETLANGHIPTVEQSDISAWKLARPRVRDAAIAKEKAILEAQKVVLDKERAAFHVRETKIFYDQSNKRNYCWSFLVN